jgi:hypothetical protein
LGVKYGLFDEPDRENPLYNPRPLTVDINRDALVDDSSEAEQKGEQDK